MENSISDKIDLYLDGKMSSEEKSAFEKEISNNKTFQQEVEMQSDLRKGMDRLHLKSEISSQFRKMTLRNKIYKWGIATVAIVAIGTAAYFGYTKMNGNSAENNQVNKNLSVNNPPTNSLTNNSPIVNPPANNPPNIIPSVNNSLNGNPPVKNSQKRIPPANNSQKGNSTGNNSSLPKLNEEGKAQWSDADRNLPTQLFSIDPDKDTILETEGGIVFAVPAHAFMNAKNPVTLEVREALTPMEIMTAGLSTMSDGKLLETGGMFYLNARNGEENLKMNTAKSIYANVPADEINPDMMIFDGERKPDGSINWTNPVKIEKQLIPVDIHTLDFYPNGFREKVAALGFDANSKRVTDSIYYSYAGRKQTAVFYDESNFVPVDSAVPSRRHRFARYDDSGPQIDSSKVDTIYNYNTGAILEINPARIAAIWNDQFQNTIIATKEFEERLQVIFKSGKPELLDLYINNLDKKMYQIDSMVLNYCEGNTKISFLEFYARHDGGIAITETHMKELQSYFNLKRKAVQRAMEKTFADRMKKEAAEDKVYASSKAQQSANDAKRYEENLVKEMNVNMTESLRQLGIHSSANYFSKSFTGVIPNHYYGFPLISVGWHNIDSYVGMFTRSRTTINYTDQQTGKTAIINYEPVTINISGFSNYDQLTVYLVPDSLKSFMKVKGSAGKYDEQLNELLGYDLVVIGQKDGKYFWARRNNIKTGSIEVSLEAIEEAQLKAELNVSFSTTVTNDFKKEIAVMNEEHKYQLQLQARKKQEEIDAEIMPVIFPFYSYGKLIKLPPPIKPGRKN